MSPQTIHFGLLLLPSYQWLDAAGSADYINLHSQASLKFAKEEESVVAKAPIIEWHYISHNLEPVQASSGPAGIPTCTYDTCPLLDYLVIPGPDPTAPLPEGCAAFLQKLMAQESFRALLTICTGSLAIAPSGVLDGLNVCSNKTALRSIALSGQLYKKVKWVGDRRWIVDGMVWSSAGITAGIDLAAEFARVHFDPLIVQLAKDASEYVPNPAQPDPFAYLLDGVDLS
ncbi:class I glutamine amidotransferase-like protein [Pholiota conissans]|uniref:Class I glutamine amidotransferase-like protein n=1 Tax=Pholiota conissans TaxID=109636 RepID=A0A9P5YXJ0_9AGAR|nr:class I glutamine amidotransferase-like protein [Pholiota conissans]